MAEFLERSYQRFNAAVLLLGILAVVVLAAASFLRLTGETVLQSGARVTHSRLQALFDLLLGGIIALELDEVSGLLLLGLAAAFAALGAFYSLLSSLERQQGIARGTPGPDA